MVFAVINVLMRLAPIGAFGAMAFTVGRYGIRSLGPLLELVGVFYLTGALFVVVVLGAISAWAGFNIFKLLNYIKAELLLTLGTSSSDPALPTLMEKLERAGCSRPVVSLVVPTGYVFNTDGSNIYLTLAALFVAQATNTPLSLEQQAALFGVALLTSKGSGGVTGAGFIALVATLERGALHPARRHGADPGHRPLHERGAGDREPDRQRGGDGGDGAHRGRTGCRPPAPGAERPA